VGVSPHIMIIVFMRVNHFIYTMYNIYTIYTHSLIDSLLLTETFLVRPVYSFYRFRTDPLKTTLVTSQLRHPLHSNGLLRMDRPTENPASNSVTVLLHSNILLVTMKMKSTSHCIATDPHHLPAEMVA
jgi:hypothetical protein